MTPNGKDSPHYRHGGRSRIIPPALRDRVHDSLHDPDLLALRQDIAALDIRLSDLYAALSYAKGDVSYGKDGGTWARLATLARAARAALDSAAAATSDALAVPNDSGDGDDSAKRNVFDSQENGRGNTPQSPESPDECHNNGDRALEAIRALIDAVQAGLSDQHVWEQIREETDHRRKLVESERKRLVELSQMITAQQLVVMMGAIMDTIRRHVSDRDTLLAISRDVQRLQSLPERAESE